MIFARLLARSLGRTVPELCETMSTAEFHDHYRDYLRNPWGPDRDALHAAMIAQTIADYAGKTRKAPAKLEEFLFKFGPQEPAEATAEPDPISHFKQFT